METVSMDLIGEFHPPSSKGNRYALTAVCMLTGYTFCIPLKNKSAEEIVTAWRNHITFLFGVCRKLLMDNTLSLKMNYFPESQSSLELKEKSIHLHKFHKFLKSCLAKYIFRHWEWDDVVPLATASYNWLPNQHSKECTFLSCLVEML